MSGYLNGWSANEHTVEPAPGSIRDGEGELIGEDAAECAYCGAPISGDENGFDHVYNVAGY